jgi:putative ABC transport system permease protein
MFVILKQNLTHSIRTLLKNPGFTATAVLTLALGIGVTTAIFSVVYATLFEPMAYPKPDQLVVLWSKIQEGRNSTSVGDFLDWKQRSKSFQQLGAWTGSQFNVATRERPEQIDGSPETPGFFTMMGIQMMLGRDFVPEEGQVGNEHSVILSHRLWESHFGADREIIGKPIRMNGESYTVVGVTPPGLVDRHPYQLWVPLAFKAEQVNHDTHFITVMGRLREGVSLAQAQVEMNGIAQQLAQEYPKSNKNLGVSVELLHLDFLPRETRRNLWLLLAAVGFLLLIGCVNVANLLLARATTRRREVALRAALGASRLHIFGQFITESILLAVIGGAVGVLLAGMLVQGITALMPPLLPSEADIRISIPVLVFTLLMTMLSGLIFGTAPAWQASRQDLMEVLKLGGRTGAGTNRRSGRRALIIAEFALALTLLAAGGLTLRSFWNLTRVDLGVRTEHVLTFGLPVPDGKLTAAGKINNYYQQIIERVQSTPAVSKAAVSTGMPTQGPNFGLQFSIVGKPAVEPSARPGAGFLMVTPGYYDALGIRVTKGRKFDEHDTANSIRVAMVNEDFVRRYLSGADPLAQRITVEELVAGAMKLGPPVEWQIVGVFPNVRAAGAHEDFPEIDVPFWQSPWPQASMVVKTDGDPATLTKSIAAAVNEVDPELPIAGVKTLDQIVSQSLAGDRFGMVMFSSFAVLGLLLAAVGVYGVMAFAVAQRTQEFGVRMALGAQRLRILNQVLREGAILAGIGTIVGLGGAYLVGRLMQSTLYGVEAFDVRAFSAVAAVLLVAALLACLLPAWRASRVEPMTALRHD